MDKVLLLVMAIIAIAFLCIVAWIVIRTFVKFRGTKLVTCPETERIVAVDVYATHLVTDRSIRKTAAVGRR